MAEHDLSLASVELRDLDASTYELFRARLAAAYQQHGLAERYVGAARAAPAVAECGEDGDPSSDAERGECVVGTGKPFYYAKPKHLDDLSLFEVGLQGRLLNNPKSAGANRVDKMLREVRMTVSLARGNPKSMRGLGSRPPVSVTELAALFKTTPVLEYLKTVSRNRAQKVLGSILCALIHINGTSEAIVPDESAVADGPRTCQALIDFYKDQQRAARLEFSVSKTPSKAQKENWVHWQDLAAAAVALETQVRSDMAERGGRKIDLAQLKTLLAFGVMTLNALFIPARLNESTKLWLTKSSSKKDEDYDAKNWVHWTPGTLGVDREIKFVWNQHKCKTTGMLGVVTTSPTQDCFERFRVAFRLYAAELLKVAGLPEDTNIPLFIDPKAFLEDRCLRPMNDRQLANYVLRCD